MILAEDHVQATSGSGARGTSEVFDLSLDGSDPIKLIVFQQAAGTDAKQFDVTEIPIEFTSE